MKRKLFLGLVSVIALSFVAGCSFGSFKLFEKSGSQQKVTETQVQKKPVESAGVIDAKVNELVNQVVEELNAGKWDKAITVGESAYAAAEKFPALAKNDLALNSTFNSTKEKLYETVVEAYDYKNHIKGLNPDEKKRYIQFARLHLKIDPADPFKKLALSKVLLDCGEIKEGLKLATEVYNSPVKNKEITENYAWALYLSGKKAEAYNIYKNFYIQADSLVQLFHSAVVIEEKDKLLGLILYKGCERAGNNLMVLEPNLKNQSSQSYINSIIVKAKKEQDRLLVGGYRVDSQYNIASIDNIIKSIVNLNKK